MSSVNVNFSSSCGNSVVELDRLLDPAMWDKDYIIWMIILLDPAMWDNNILLMWDNS